MTKIGRIVIAALMLGALVAGLSGCQKKEGPAERAGKAIDNAAEKTGEGINKAAEKTGEGINKAINKTGETMEKAGEKMQDAAKDVKK